ncbi:6111_t:CDS:2 [Gigaspora margarita]|uniref:6111_t:CDS:1 n=1 Tax=Gigaspora margarita TaxID=4874 RepID=A0ABN7UAP4_GIGMA|nr:6111_t:CDS:2 [Gigaspora margarita]
MTVIDRLSAKRIELEIRLNNSYQGGSQRRETLLYKIKKIEELIDAYQAISSPIDFSEAEKLLNQQVGFTELKEKILNSLKIKDYCEQRNIKKDPLILCLVGPPGVGKTTLAALLAQALKKEFFAVSLGGMSDNSLLVGANESSSGTEIGQLAKALTETKTHDPLILLDEIDKVDSYGGNSAIHSCLSSVLDPVQNPEILDYYLDVKLDFSKVTFIVTANDLNKIPKYLLSRTPLIVDLNQNNLEITSQTLETLISKTQEKGVRQLKSALDSIFDYCLLQWAQEASQGKPESKIKVNSDLVNQIIPADFFNISSEDNSENKNDKKELEILRKELERLKGEKNRQSQLKAIKFNSLLVLRQVRGNFAEKEYLNYEGKINTALSQEEIEIIEKEFLLKIKQKNTSPKPVREKESKKEKDNAPINSQREKIRKYFNLLVEEFITDPRHKKDISIIFENYLESSKPNLQSLGHTQQYTNIETTRREINGVKTTSKTYSYRYEISFLNNYKNEDELRGTVVHEFTHLYLFATIGKHGHDDRFYSTMERLENWLNKNQGLKPRVDKSHDRDQYGKDTDFSDEGEKENFCPECSYFSPHHSPQCSHNQNNSRPTKNTTDPQKVSEFNLLKKLIKNSQDLATLEKNYQTVKGNSLYSSSEVFSKNDKDGNSIKNSNEQPTNNSNSSLKGNESGAGSIFWLCLAGGVIILVGTVAYLALNPYAPGLPEEEINKLREELSDPNLVPSSQNNEEELLLIKVLNRKLKEGKIKAEMTNDGNNILSETQSVPKGQTRSVAEGQKQSFGGDQRLKEPKNEERAIVLLKDKENIEKSLVNWLKEVVV